MWLCVWYIYYVKTGCEILAEKVLYWDHAWEIGRNEKCQHFINRLQTEIKISLYGLVVLNWFFHLFFLNNQQNTLMHSLANTWLSMGNAFDKAKHDLRFKLSACSCLWHKCYFLEFVSCRCVAWLSTETSIVFMMMPAPTRVPWTLHDDRRISWRWTTIHHMMTVLPLLIHESGKKERWHHERRPP